MIEFFMNVAVMGGAVIVCSVAILFVLFIIGLFVVVGER